MRVSLFRPLLNRCQTRAMSSDMVKMPGEELDPHKKGVGIERKYTKDKYVNPLLSPPPRSPKAPEDFKNPETLGHWFPLGFDWTNPKVDQHTMNETLFALLTCGVISLWLWSYGPDYKLRDWCKREAYLRTYKREALGLPLIDKNVVDPERVVLPSEEELADWIFPVTM